VKAQLLIPAAGQGLRLGSSGPKALIDLAGRPMIVRALERFRECGLVDGAVIVTPPDAIEAFHAALSSAFPEAAFRFAAGGEERQQSVDNGLNALDPGTEIVVIHDAARPFVGAESIRASIKAAAAYGAATVAIPCIDTILVADEDSFLTDTPDRRTLWACQTPQTFQVSVIRDAHAYARKNEIAVTDDATIVRKAGGRPKLVMGSPLNFKVTTPADLAMAQFVIREGLA